MVCLITRLTRIVLIIQVISFNVYNNFIDVTALPPSSSDNKVLTSVLAVIIPFVLSVAIAVAIACYLR